jgi:hypothetical protein
MPPLLEPPRIRARAPRGRQRGLRAWSIASVSVSTPKARRAMSNFRWSITTFFPNPTCSSTGSPWTRPPYRALCND